MALNHKREFHVEFGGKTITIETGRLAKQADGSVLVTCEDTQVLVTVCSARKVQDGQDFFPLLVDYKEKFYAGGKFLGGFMKREGRPSNDEILLMRMIDRPLRPLFPEGYMFETIIMAQVISYGASFDPEVLAGIGAPAALEISDIPFQGPLGFCKVGKIDGKLVLNPNKEEFENSTIELVVAASNEAILMVEGEADEVSEAEMLEALNFAHTEIKKICATIEKMKTEVGKAKREFISAAPNTTLVDEVEKAYESDARAALNITDKLERQHATNAIMDKVKSALKENPSQFGLSEDSDFGKESYKAVDELMYKMMRGDILDREHRIGGRKLNEVREIETEVDVLKKTHGSSLFTRGETQVMATVTMGGKDGEQMADKLSGISFSKFYLHYTFAPFSVGEARGYRGVGRREVGHGNLAERSIKKVLPPEAEFPYTLRVNCEVLESNGSSSMGSVCSGSMALMDAGVPLKAPVAGVAMGLVKDGDRFKILTDILGDEDHLGDMDFKVAGTQKGITAIQMDIKITGITEEIFKTAMEEARVGRLHILDEMSKTISGHRGEFKDGVPQIMSTKIEPDKIGMLIGPSGKNIKSIQETYSVVIDIAEDGKVNVNGTDTAVLAEVIDLINLQITGPKLNDDYDATVVSLKEYGAFVDLAPGVSGLLHVSEIADERIQDVSVFLKEGDSVKVRVLDIDRFGKVKLSAKAIAPLEAKYEGGTVPQEAPRDRDRGDRRPRRDDRRGGGRSGGGRGDRERRPRKQEETSES